MFTDHVSDRRTDAVLASLYQLEDTDEYGGLILARSPQLKATHPQLCIPPYAFSSIPSEDIIAEDYPETRTVTWIREQNYCHPFSNALLVWKHGPQKQRVLESRNIDLDTLALVENLGPNNPELHIPLYCLLKDGAPQEKVTFDLDEDEYASRIEEESVSQIGLKGNPALDDDPLSRLPIEKCSPYSASKSRSSKLQTNKRVLQRDTTLASSTALSEHVVTMIDRTSSTLPAFRPISPSMEGSSLSSHADKLPALGDIVRSPSCSYHDAYGSPTDYTTSAAMYSVADSSRSSWKTNISSISNAYSIDDKNADAYSTAHTTPIDIPDDSPRPMPPPPPKQPQNATLIPTGFKCDYPGCTAIPFQTQYLLK